MSIHNIKYEYTRATSVDVDARFLHKMFPFFIQQFCCCRYTSTLHTFLSVYLYISHKSFVHVSMLWSHGRYGYGKHIQYVYVYQWQKWSRFVFLTAQFNTLSKCMSVDCTVISVFQFNCTISKPKFGVILRKNCIE